MLGFLKSLLLPRDEPLERLKANLEGKLFVEILKTKINRHQIFWIGRSEYERHELRVGIEFSGGRRYFYNWVDFRQDVRCSEFQLMTPVEADAMEEKIKQDRINRKREKNEKSDKN